MGLQEVRVKELEEGWLYFELGGDFFFLLPKK